MLDNSSTSNIKEFNLDNYVHAVDLVALNSDKQKFTAIRTGKFSTQARLAHAPQSAHMKPVSSSPNKSPFDRLYMLELDRNEITTIDEYAFCGLTNLIYLDLSYNQLRVIHAQTFAGLIGLTHLELEHNQITTIHENALNLPELEQLYLSGNKLTRLSDTIFTHLHKLSVIRLDRNSLEHIGRSLNGLTKITLISLSINRVQDIDLMAFVGLSALHTLELAESGFTFATTKIPNDRTKWNSSLEYLDIRRNDLANVDDLKKLRIFPNIRFIHLNGNPLRQALAGHREILTQILPHLNNEYSDFE